uniref:rho guanine nucleotide exchange factor 3-like n=1 Tax=Pristiophorus japonicus TaxID=55135 RepID=UPI00398F47F7
MLKLCIMSEEELSQIFGSLYSLIPLHEDLLSRLQQVRRQDGTVFEVGRTLADWLPSLSAYETYCCNQVAAKALLDYKKQQRPVDEFLRLCQESAFSRKLDLWSFLDLPRSRLVKYPLLLKEIVRHTPTEHPDQQELRRAMELIQGIVAQVNVRTGEAECRYYRQRLCYLDDSQLEPLIEHSSVLCCHGELKNNKGAKLRVFLFERALVISRPVSRNQRPCFQVYRTPIPVHQLVLEDLPDGETRVSGSLRGAFSNSTERAKNIFRVSFRDRSRGQSHTLQANDSFNKQQWVSCIRQAVINSRDIMHSQLPVSESSLEQIASLSIDCDDEMHETDTD